MENRINLVELLKDCPKGMELDCTICNGVKFIELDRNPNFAIVVRANNGYEFTLTKYGQVHNIDDAKCVIFPKGKTTWEGFVPPCKFKDGDILYVDTNDHGDDNDIFKYVFILKVIVGRKNIAHCYITADGYFKPREVYLTDDKYPIRFATEEEKQKLFDAIKANGYKWNAETKTLEKLIKPKFKVGDRIKHKIVNSTHIITEIKNEYYIMDEISFPHGLLPIEAQDEYELVPNKFDINILKPFESRVLVRDENTDEWRGHFFSHYDSNSDRPYVCIGIEGINEYKRCIPYKDNEHLLGKTDDCSIFYKTWE